MMAIMKEINVDHNSLIDSADHEGCEKSESLFFMMPIISTREFNNRNHNADGIKKICEALNKIKYCHIVIIIPN